jgi:hypothetical protein
VRTCVSPQSCALKNGGVCGSPVVFSSYRQVSRWSVLGRVMGMEILCIRDVM